MHLCVYSDTLANVVFSLLATVQLYFSCFSIGLFLYRSPLFLECLSHVLSSLSFSPPLPPFARLRSVSPSLFLSLFPFLTLSLSCARMLFLSSTHDLARSDPLTNLLTLSDRQTTFTSNLGYMTSPPSSKLIVHA